MVHLQKQEEKFIFQENMTSECDLAERILISIFFLEHLHRKISEQRYMYQFPESNDVGEVVENDMECSSAK